MKNKEIVKCDLDVLKIMLKQFEKQKSISQTVALKDAIEIIELFLAGKLTEPMSKKKIKKIILGNKLLFNMTQDTIFEIAESLAQALVGKIGKSEEGR